MIATGASVCSLDTAARLTSGPMAHAGTAIRVVVVDDDELYVTSLGELIEQQPELTVVGTAGNGIEAIELADQVAPDAIVIDLHMPRLDGVSAVARLRSDHPSMCLIALTGDPSPELQRAATEAGADAVLHKSEMLDALFARLAEARPHANGR
jgi:DNA-binding NarL/FixJ family response regulator